MAALPRSTQSVPASVPSDPALPEIVDAPISAEPTVVNVDHSTGAVTVEQPGGGALLQFPGAQTERQPRGAASFDDNLAEDIDNLPGIAQRLLEGIDADIRSRKQWEETANRAADYLGITLEEATSTVSPQGTVAKVWHTLLLDAVVHSWANARAELLPVGGPVKVRDDQVPTPAAPPPERGMGDNGGPPLDEAAAQPGQPTRDEIAEALETDMNHYLTVVDREYYPDFSKMLFNRALIGIAFRKVYRCPLRRRPVSVWVKGQDLIVSNDAAHLMGAGRVTERIKMRQAVVKRLQAAGHWRDIALTQPVDQASPTETKVGQIEGINPMPELPADHRHEILECYTELDDGPLARDETGRTPGYPLPYRVTLDRDSRQVLEIRRNWKVGDADHKARRRYVKYGFIPGLGFYDLGFIHLIGNPQRAATAIERMLIDAGMFASFPGGIYLKSPGSRQTTTEIRPGPGQWIGVDGAGVDDIRKIYQAMPYKEPSATLAAIGQDIVAQARKLAGTTELPVGEGRVGNVPVGTIMSFVEQISQVPSAVHKDDHIAQQEEFELLRELFVEEPEALSKFARSPARKWEVAQEIADRELVPAADPNTPSQVHRIHKAAALVEMGGLPQFQGIIDQRKLFERTARVLGEERVEDLMMPQQPAAQAPPDPRIVAAQMKGAADQQRTQGDIQKEVVKGEVRLKELEAEKDMHEATQQNENLRAGLTLEGRKVQAATDLTKHATGIASEHIQQANDLAQADRHKAVDVATDTLAQGIAPPPAAP